MARRVVFNKVVVMLHALRRKVLEMCLLANMAQLT